MKSAISDPGEARPVKKVIIWTPTALTSDDNIVLYDVPGYDSAVTLHIELTRAKMQYYFQNNLQLLNEILKISDTTNPFIKAKDKIIVALTSCKFTS